MVKGVASFFYQKSFPITEAITPRVSAMILGDSLPMIQNLAFSAHSGAPHQVTQKKET